jgi:hypothetical protein
MSLPRMAALIPSLCPGIGICRHLDAAASTIAPSLEGEHRMDLVYLVLAVLFWLLLVGMAVGCSKLGGPAK